MKIASSGMHVRAQLTLLVLATVALAFLSFLPTPHQVLISSETRFSEASLHGLNIIPASCASGAQYYHTTLTFTGDTGGFVLPPGASEYGDYSQGAAMYVCASNASANTYFIPAKTAYELSAFKAHPPTGVIAY